MRLPRAGVLHVGDVELDLDAWTVSVGRRPIRPTKMEFQLLKLLLSNAGRVVSRKELSELLWGASSAPEKSIEVLMGRLRHLIEIDPHRPAHIRTIRGVGYLFEAVAVDEPSYPSEAPAGEAG